MFEGTRMPAPLIGITTDIGAAAWRDRVREAALSPAAYTRAIERAGAVPVLLPPVLPGASSRLAARLDGLVFAGGADVDARCYGAAGDDRADWPGYTRDAVELALMRAAIETRTPFLAICRGLQVLNVARGGTLVQGLVAAAGPDQDAPGEHARGGARPGYAVRISPDSRLGHILGASATVPWSRNRAVAKLGAGVIAIAWAAQEVVAAVELTGHPFGIGVQWHPELADDMRIFEQLRTAAADRAQAASAAAGQ
jgi:gamma-glutamyl-gamma-aminobutyrate hydrolase PuuD